ncbi:hypothetical protein GCM10023149_07810 [Mucilaginibacter gynuensis]|uniref:FAS1 domain-containing protein n=1 Tax=Mucilaginibacter gynuensis TaxID=1302236 RepID=A0ABP8FWI1_9SPHI
MNNIIFFIKYKGRICFACLMLLCTLLSACKYDDLSVTKPNENFRLAGDFLRNNYDYSLFYEALDYTGLAKTLNEPGPFTVIAPNNTAFNELGIQLPSDIRKLNRDSLRQAMAYHIIPRKLTFADFPVNSVDVRYETLAGISLYASFATFNPTYPEYPRNAIYFSGCMVMRKDVPLVNGVLQAVEKVMQQYPGKTVQNWLAERPDYSIFVAGLKKFGLWDELSGAGPFTIFAPKNSAFIEAGITPKVVEQLNTAEYIGPRLFGAYIIYGKDYFISDRDVFETINSEGNFILTTRNDNSKFTWFGPDMALEAAVYSWYYRVYPTKNDIAKSDNLCENGKVHTLSGVLVKLENCKKN